MLGKLDAGKIGRMETGQMGTWGREGGKGRGGLERLRTDLRWTRRLVTGGRKSWRWAGVMGEFVVCARD